MLRKLLFNIFIVYALWQIFRMFTAVKKTQQNFHEKMNEMDEDIKRSKQQNAKTNTNNDGEYIDYEEIK